MPWTLTSLFKGRIPSARDCRDRFKTLSATVLSHMGKGESSLELDQATAPTPAPPFFPSPPVPALPDDMQALVFALTNPLRAPANTYDVGSNLPTDGLSILPELGDIFGGTDASASLQNPFWLGMAPLM
jgi:hypothetical protein